MNLVDSDVDGMGWLETELAETLRTSNGCRALIRPRRISEIIVVIQFRHQGLLQVWLFSDESSKRSEVTEIKGCQGRMVTYGS